MVVNRAKDTSSLNGHHSHSKFSPYHTHDLWAKVNHFEQLYRNPFRFRGHNFIVHRTHLYLVLSLIYILDTYLKS